MNFMARSFAVDRQRLKVYGGSEGINSEITQMLG